MKNWIPLTHIEQPKGEESNYIVRVVVKIPHDYEISDYGKATYDHEPDPHYDNPPERCGKPYTITRIIIEFEKKVGTTNWLPRYFKYKLDPSKVDPNGDDPNKDSHYQVIVRKKNQTVDHDGQSSGAYGDAD